MPNSFQWYEYIGATGGNAYLESGHPAFIGKGNQITIYWVPLSELPETLSEQLKKGNPPWKSLRKQNAKSGSRGSLTPSPHTTKQAGPHLAVRKAPSD